MANPFLDKIQSDTNFINVFEAMIGFSHISVKQNIVSNAWAQIQGLQNTISLSAGWTKAQDQLDPKDLRFRNIIDRPHDCFKFIYFNPDQLMLLYNRLPFVIFASDYGGGKITVICYQKRYFSANKIF